VVNFCQAFCLVMDNGQGYCSNDMFRFIFDVS
jgi:hypothetical protein